MSVSFIVFIIVAVVVVAVAAFCLGAWVSKATKKESPEAQNTTPYEDCLAKNANKFKYGSFTDARDGETYRTVKIGGQVWMAENLRYNAEDSYPAGNDESNVKKFGRLYKWTTALGIPAIFSEQSPANDMEMYRKIKADNYQGIAPEGWHIPSSKEWEQLMNNLDSKSNGSELRSKCVWNPVQIRSAFSPCLPATASTTAASVSSASAPAFGARMNTGSRTPTV